MMESYVRELREVQEERIKIQASIKITPEEMEQIYATLSSKTSASSKSKLVYVSQVSERKAPSKTGDSTTADKSSLSRVTSNAKRLKTDCLESSIYPAICPKDRQMLSEFNKDSETIFAQDDACYEHYKEIQREVK
jgi:hypothetical protein